MDLIKCSSENSFLIAYLCQSYLKLDSWVPNWAGIVDVWDNGQCEITLISSDFESILFRLNGQGLSGASLEHSYKGFL